MMVRVTKTSQRTYTSRNVNATAKVFRPQVSTYTRPLLPFLRDFVLILQTIFLHKSKGDGVFVEGFTSRHDVFNVPLFAILSTLRDSSNRLWLDHKYTIIDRCWGGGRQFNFDLRSLRHTPYDLPFPKPHDHLSLALTPRTHSHPHKFPALHGFLTPRTPASYTLYTRLTRRAGQLSITWVAWSPSYLLCIHHIVREKNHWSRNKLFTLTGSFFQVPKIISTYVFFFFFLIL